MRIISTLASGTEIVAELGLHDNLVGISHECDYPPDLQDRPRVSRPRFDPDGLTSGEIDEAVRRAMIDHGSVYAVDADLIEELEPDLILAQAVCEVCAVPTAGVKELVHQRGLGARILSLDAHTIEEILLSVEDVGRATEVETRALARTGAIRRRLAAVHESVAGSPRPRVLAIEWLDPPFAPGHWVPEMIEIAGGDNLVGEAGEPSREIGWPALAPLDPDVLIVMPCGYGLEAASEDANRHSGRLLEVAPRAVQTGRAFIVDASAYFNRSGPRFVTGVEILARLFHPGCFTAPEAATSLATAAREWQPAGANRPADPGDPSSPFGL